MASRHRVVSGDTLLIGHDIRVSITALGALARRYHIRRLTLFGSTARGEFGPESDIDLIVEFESGKAPSLGGINHAIGNIVAAT